MFELDEKVLDVAGHTDTTQAGCVVPFDVNIRKHVASNVKLDPMELLENIAKMVEVFYPNILNSKVINYETELDGIPFVMPEAWGAFGFVITLSKKARSEEIVGKNAGLGKAITALANLEVDPPSQLQPCRLYSSMNSVGMSAVLMQTYLESGIGVSR
jgi:hypothetical protein